MNKKLKEIKCVLRERERVREFYVSLLFKRDSHRLNLYGIQRERKVFVFLNVLWEES